MRWGSAVTLICQQAEPRSHLALGLGVWFRLSSLHEPKLLHRPVRVHIHA